jgi:hypothetical protein
LWILSLSQISRFVLFCNIKAIWNNSTFSTQTLEIFLMIPTNWQEQES